MSPLNNEQFVEGLHRPVIKKKTWGADLVDTHLISKFNKGFRFLLCVIDIFSK